MKKKIKIMLCVLYCNVMIMVGNMNVVMAGGFDEGAAKSWVQSYSKPFLSFLLWAIPIGCAIACLIVVGNYLTKDPEEKEQSRPGKLIKKIVFWSVIAESITAILAIVGL